MLDTHLYRGAQDVEIIGEASDGVIYTPAWNSKLSKQFCRGGWIQSQFISDVDCIQISDLQFIPSWQILKLMKQSLSWITPTIYSEFMVNMPVERN